MEQYKQLLKDCEEYLRTRYDLLRLELLDKLSQIIGLLVLIIVASFLVMGAVAYFSVALVHVLSQVMSVSLACIILGVLLLCILLILYKQREKIFIDPFVKILSSLIFSENEESTSENGIKPVEKEVTNEPTE